MGFLLRNWHLKLSAVLLATILYTGLVFSGSFSESRIQVPIEDVNQPQDAYNLSGALGMVDIRYRTVDERPPALTAEQFVARVDLSQYDMDRAPEPQVLDIEVVSLLDGVQVIDHDPETVRVELDHVDTRTVPVDVDAGTVPEGLDIGEPTVSETEVQVRGPASVVDLVDRVVARIRVDPSGIDFNEPVTLLPVDVEGQPVGVGLLDVAPDTVSVQVEVEAVETTDTLPVRPVVEGDPAAGFALESITVDPPTVTLRGLPEALQGVTEVLTEPLSIAEGSEDQTFDAELVLPEGLRLARDGTEPVVTVTVTIVPSVASRTFLIGVVCQGAGQNACLPGFGELSLTLSGPSNVLSGLSAANLTPVLNVGGLAPGTYTITPVLPALPEDVEVLALSPGTVPVQIVAPATPAPTPTP